MYLSIELPGTWLTVADGRKISAMGHASITAWQAIVQLTFLGYKYGTTLTRRKSSTVLSVMIVLILKKRKIRPVNHYVYIREKKKRQLAWPSGKALDW